MAAAGFAQQVRDGVLDAPRDESFGAGVTDERVGGIDAGGEQSFGELARGRGDTFVAECRPGGAEGFHDADASLSASIFTNSGRYMPRSSVERKLGERCETSAAALSNCDRVRSGSSTRAEPTVPGSGRKVSLDLDSFSKKPVL
ncbi:hypothetical protein ACIRRA_39945 [Nocardia sp. NPDC101769]|uniref:hypothetical protein n=1 Tax=Nocardia sp. NPDC101769 TaxID=3364333 RepID=UPI00380148E5